MLFEELSKREDVPIIVVNSSGIVSYVNDMFCKQLRWNREAIEGKSLTIIIPEVLRDAHHLGFARHLETGRRSVLGLAMELAVVFGDGTVASAEHYILDGNIGGEMCYAASIVPAEKG